MRMLDDRATQKVTANGLEFACQVYAPAGAEADAAIVLIRGLGTQLIEWSPVLIESLVAGDAGVEASFSVRRSLDADAERTAELFCGIVNRWRALGGTSHAAVRQLHVQARQRPGRDLAGREI